LGGEVNDHIASAKRPGLINLSIEYNMLQVREKYFYEGSLVFAVVATTAVSKDPL